MGAMLATLCACEDENEVFKREQYENLVYIVSNKNNIFEAEYELDGSNRVYLPVSYGGTRRIERNVTVTIKADRELFDQYNKKTYDLETDKYAKLLAPDRYSLPDRTVVLSPDNEFDYSLMPVEIPTEVLESLSPDSTYFISFAIDNVSDGYRFNKDKAQALYRIYKKNAYATTKGSEYYSFKGYKNGNYQTSATKKIFPHTKDKVRMFVGPELYLASTVTEKEIKQKSVIVRIDPETNHLTMEPLDTKWLEVELLPAPEDEEETFVYTNTYNPENLTFSMYYRYRCYDEATETFGDWIEIKERSAKNVVVDE